MSASTAKDRAARRTRRSILRSHDAPGSVHHPSYSNDVIDLTGEPSSPVAASHAEDLPQAHVSQHENNDNPTESFHGGLYEHQHNQAHSPHPPATSSHQSISIHHTQLFQAGNDHGNDEEIVDEDDVCPICQLLLYDPVRTTLCGHYLCGFCMETWASVSLQAPSSGNIRIVDVDDDTDDTAQHTHADGGSSHEARCPMCRTLTTTIPDPSRAAILRDKYPLIYAAREADVRAEQHASAQGMSGSQTITIAIGNRHTLVPPSPGALQDNQHEWTFFLRLSGPSSRVRDMIEEVHVHLHPTFRPNKVVLRPRLSRRGEGQGEEFQITRLGWGVFEITADVMLKAGYEWAGSNGGGEVRDTGDGARNGVLGLEWRLDFEGFGGKGSMKRVKCSVRNEGGADLRRTTRRGAGTRGVSSGQFGDGDEDYEVEDQDEDEDDDPEMMRDLRETRRMIRQYERDGRYEPSTRRGRH